MGRLILTGFMGTGKTTVGRRAAERLGWVFVDTDELIEATEGRTIAAIFSKEGEAYFRAREREAIRKVAALENVVIATGGGTIVDEENLRVLEAAGPVVCLTARVDVILQRTRGDSRPLLADADGETAVRSLLAAREAAYRRATYTIDTSEIGIDAVVERVVEIARRHGAESGGG